MNKKVFFGATLIMLGAQVISAQEVNQEEKVNELDEVVISDSKFKLKREQSGKVITKISSEELERSQGQSVATVLNRVAGIEINGSNSGAGKNLNYNIRGGSNRQVVIRIDGITVNDPSTISGEFDLRLLSIDQIESIEILKGASSTLFGSGAATGVINIITKKESKEAIAAQFSFSLGTNQSQEDQEYDVNEFVNSASINGTIGKVNYLASFSNQFTDGLSEAEKLDEDTSSQEFKSDSYSKYNVYAKLGYQWNKNFKFHFFGNIDDYKNEFDVGNGIDGNNNGTSRQVRGGSFWEAKYPNGSFTFVDSYALLEREFITDFPSRSESRVYTFDAYNKYKFGNWLYTVIGANGSYNDYNGFSASGRGEKFVQTINDNQADFDIIDPYVNLVYASKFGLNINAGARLNIHSAYGNHMVYSVNPSYTYTFGGNYIKGLASYSTAYITPSLFQLFSPSFGNFDLEPEENRTIEGGIELSLDKKTIISAVYFTRDQKNAVDFVDTGNFVFQYQNISEEFTTDGLEFEVNSKLMNDKMILRGNFTYTNVDEELSNIGIPEIKFNASVGYNISSKSFVSLSYQYNDEREGRFTDFTTFASESRTLDSYGILDFYISHQLMDNFSIYAAMNNVTNEEYQEIFGFSTRGRNARIGFNLKF